MDLDALAHQVRTIRSDVDKILGSRIGTLIGASGGGIAGGSVSAEAGSGGGHGGGGYDDLARRIDEMRDWAGEVNTRLDAVEGQVRHMGERQDAVEERLSAVDRGIADVLEHLSAQAATDAPTLLDAQGNPVNEDGSPAGETKDAGSSKPSSRSKKAAKET